MNIVALMCNIYSDHKEITSKIKRVAYPFKKCVVIHGYGGLEHELKQERNEKIYLASGHTLDVSKNTRAIKLGVNELKSKALKML